MGRAGEGRRPADGLGRNRLASNKTRSVHSRVSGNPVLPKGTDSDWAELGPRFRGDERGESTASNQPTSAESLIHSVYNSLSLVFRHASSAPRADRADRQIFLSVFPGPARLLFASPEGSGAPERRKQHLGHLGEGAPPARARGRRAFRRSTAAIMGAGTIFQADQVFPPVIPTAFAAVHPTRSAPKGRPS